MGVSYSDIIERMRWAGKLKNDSAVARVLGVTPQALSNYKKRGEMPTDLVLRFANIYGLSVDWLITGEGEMYKAAGRSAEYKSSYMIAAEETPAYGKDAKEYGRVPDVAALSADEIIYVGKLLKILRGPNKSTASAIKYSVDAFLKAAEQPVETVYPEGGEKETKN
ncbi:MAG: helix-turn-helix domain-containing protein [Deltaproteobacteria bacterium]|nr:helix-turn-helix domain-containing protein [Deltaproteobacteria bacterium]